MLNCDIGHSTACPAAARMQSGTSFLAVFNGSARSKAAARMGSPLSRTGSKCVGSRGAPGATGAATPAARATHLGIHSAHSGRRPLRVPWRAQAGQLVERGPEPGGGRVKSGEPSTAFRPLRFAQGDNPLNSGHPTPDTRLRTPDSRHPTPDSRLPTPFLALTSLK